MQGSSKTNKIFTKPSTSQKSRNDGLKRLIMEKTEKINAIQNTATESNSAKPVNKHFKRSTSIPETGVYSYSTLKTNLPLAANKLKLLQTKKLKLAMEERTEIVGFVTGNKSDRARKRVKSIISDLFVVEAYELLEMYCELLHTRFGVIQGIEETDDEITVAVVGLLWAAPKIAHEVPEFNVITEQLTRKFGKRFAEAAKINQLINEPAKVEPKLIEKLSVNTPSKLLVEKYLIEICRCANVPFEADENIMREDDDEIALAEKQLNVFMNYLPPDQ